MKVDIYYELRFLNFPKSIDGGRVLLRPGAFLPNGSMSFRFSRTLSLPCVPLKGQYYWLTVDPAHAEICTAKFVEESGFVESKGNRPYFLVAQEWHFQEWAMKQGCLGGAFETHRSAWFKAISSHESFFDRFTELGWKREICVFQKLSCNSPSEPRNVDGAAHLGYEHFRRVLKIRGIN